MASQGRDPTRNRNLDATQGRDVVYCHACENEWFRDEFGLECPSCHSDIIEIITPDHDPRQHTQSPSPSSSSNGGHIPGLRRDDSDSDPDEADIEEHTHHGPNGFIFRRAVWQSPSGANPQGDPSPNARQHPDPSDGAAIMQRFFDMVNGFQPGMTPRPRGGQDGLFPPREEMFGAGGNIRTFSARTGPGGSISYTIATGPLHVRGPDRAGPPGSGMDPFQAMFSSILNGAGPPPLAGGDPGFQQGNQPLGFAASLHEILNLLNPANAAHGDAVYSQEALDRIISTLMENNPQSNAAPPASEDALAKLARKKVDEKMLGADGKTECTICIDDFKIGDEVAELPCHHWFHNECVVMWLKEHNTCPICRAPIEQRSNNNDNPQANLNAGASGAGPGMPSAAPGSGPLPPSGGSAFPMPWMSINPESDWAARPPVMRRGGPDRTQAGPSSSWNMPPHLSRQSSQEQSRVLPNLRPRRNSMSPPTPRAYPASEHSSRTRQRSPSSVDRDRDRDPERSQDSGHGHGPLGWLRGQFMRGSGSGSGRDRERERDRDRDRDRERDLERRRS